MRVLVLDSALTRCSAALVVDDTVVIARSEVHRQGQEAVLPVMARDVFAQALDAAKETSPCIDLVAVTVGPGSFTGIRAGLALAHGIGLALGVPVIGVTIGEAIGDAFPHLGDRVLWTVTDSRRGQIFLEREGETVSLAQEALPSPPGKVAVAGGAALHIAARLAASGANVMLTDARYALPRHIALVARRRHAGALPPRAAQPLYVDPPEARLPTGGLRPPPEASPR
ncbi:MAG: tRNA (adenosine(37)-N6)-threonylcarbamoyltransferase complex dimerization subunit type 1 TsaB [Acetobacteraceae bacterium]|jgi:tRNA threonylcarbamoyl adenosine modification protein YeaZ